MIFKQEQNINLLPSDLREKRKLVKDELDSSVEYSEAGERAQAIGGRSSEETAIQAPNFLTRRKLPPLAAPPPSGPGPTQTSAEPSASSAAPAASEEKPKASLAVAAVAEPESVAPESSSMDAAANSEPESVDVKQSPEEKEPHWPWWSRLFARRKKEESTGRTSPAAEPPASEAAGEEPGRAAPAVETLGVNLLSAEYAQAFVLKNRAAVAAWTAAASILAVAAGYTGALLYESRKMELLEAARSQNQAVSSVIVGYRELANEDELLRRKILALKFLLKKHVSLKTFLEKLEAITIPEVTYLNIAVTAGGGVNLAARASDYTAAARQLAIFKTEVPWLKDVVMSGARRTAMAESKEPSVSFDLALKVDESVFISGK